MLSTQLCQEDGGILDDLIIYRFDTEEIFSVTNSGKRKIQITNGWLSTNLYGCSITNQSDHTGRSDVQGPQSLTTTSRLISIT